MESDGDGHDILSKEWLQLSLKERNDIQEEIHSVLCMAKEESLEMIQKALENLSFELDNNIPVGEQRAYLRCKTKGVDRFFVTMNNWSRFCLQ